jgi:hypothetical protein
MQRLDLVQTEEAIMAAIDWIRSDCDSDGEHVLTLLWAAAKRLSSPAQSPPPQTPPTPPAD